MTSVLTVSAPQTASSSQPALLPAWLAAAGVDAVVWAPCHLLVHRIVQLAPRQVVCEAPREDDAPAWQAFAEAVEAALKAWGDTLPCPVLLWLPELGDAARTTSVDHWIASGLSGCVVGELSPERWRQELAWSLARWQREGALRSHLLRTRGELDDRKWVDRAKGVLMSARQIGEQEAFVLLRGAAMHANLRVGEVSRAVTEAARWADAVNRAGQLRMLPQRLVKLAAQRVAGLDARRSRVQQEQAMQRLQDNVDQLAALPVLSTGIDAGHGAGDPALRETFGSTLAAWLAMKQALGAPAVSLPELDSLADELLQAAEALTAALEVSAGRRALHVVNLCGRQRMRSQRVAKDALLAVLLLQPARRERLPALLAEFDEALLELERAPLSSPESRAALASARDEWARLLRGLDRIDHAEGRAALVRASEALLDIFDRLTASYEHSLQVIMG